MTQGQVSWGQLAVPDPQPMDKGCPPGSLWETFPAAPALGAPLSFAPGLSPFGYFTALVYRLRSGICPPPANAFVPAGAAALFGSAVLGQATDLVERWRRRVQPDVPGAWDGPGELNPASGNLMVRLGVPAAGPFDPRPLLVYNSQNPLDSEFVRG